VELVRLRGGLSNAACRSPVARQEKPRVAEWLAGCPAERHNRVLAAGGEDDYPETWSILFDAGGDARVSGIPFDENRTAPWKGGWIDADINLGVIRAS
jgi:hypothetical protein